MNEQQKRELFDRISKEIFFRTMMFGESAVKFSWEEEAMIHVNPVNLNQDDGEVIDVEWKDVE